MANLSIKQVLTNLGKDILNWVKSNCVNNLVSDAENLPLSAAQGKVLDGKITALNSNIGAKIICYGNLTLPNASEGQLSGAFEQIKSGTGYIPIATRVIASNQNRSNLFDAAVTDEGAIYAINVPSSYYGKKCSVVFAKF